VNAIGDLVGTLRFASKSLGGTSDWREMTMVEVADLCSVGEKHAIAQPVEAVRQDDFSFGPCWSSVKVNAGGNFVAISQIDLTLMGIGKSVWLPKRHVSIIAGNHPLEANPSPFSCRGNRGRSADTLRTL
jgi:hypothetical protein